MPQIPPEVVDDLSLEQHRRHAAGAEGRVPSQPGPLPADFAYEILHRDDGMESLAWHFRDRGAEALDEFRRLRELIEEEREGASHALFLRAMVYRDRWSPALVEEVFRATVVDRVAHDTLGASLYWVQIACVAHDQADLFRRLHYLQYPISQKAVTGGLVQGTPEAQMVYHLTPTWSMGLDDGGAQIDFIRSISRQHAAMDATTYHHLLIDRLPRYGVSLPAIADGAVASSLRAMRFTEQRDAAPTMAEAVIARGSSDLQRLMLDSLRLHIATEPKEVWRRDGEILLSRIKADLSMRRMLAEGIVMQPP